MPNELVFLYDTTGLTTVYALLSSGSHFASGSGGALLNAVAGSVASAAIPLSDSALAGRYVGSVPDNTPAGAYDFNVNLRSGTSAANGDRRIGGPALLVWDGSAEVTPGSAEPGGDTPVDHNTGGADHLRVLSFGQPVQSAVLRAYLQSDWNTNAAGATLLASALTGPDGRWVEPMMLQQGNTYVIVAFLPGALNPETQTVTI